MGHHSPDLGNTQEILNMRRTNSGNGGFGSKEAGGKDAQVFGKT